MIEGPTTRSNSAERLPISSEYSIIAPMSTERLQSTENHVLAKLWVAISDKEINEARKREMKTVGTDLPKLAINKLFPDPKGELSHYPDYAPLITTPKMLEDFINQWEPQWGEKPNFSLKPAFRELFQSLRDVEGDYYIIYAQLRGLYRIFMLQNLLQTGWRPQRQEFDAEIQQKEKDREFRGRLKRLAAEHHSDTWRYWSEDGYELWKTAQAEVLAYMESTSPAWRKVFKRTQLELRGR